MVSDSRDSVDPNPLSGDTLADAQDDAADWLSSEYLLVPHDGFQWKARVTSLKVDSQMHLVHLIRWIGAVIIINQIKYRVSQKDKDVIVNDKKSCTKTAYVGSLVTMLILHEKDAPIKQTKKARHGRLVNIPKWSEMVNLVVFDHLGPFWAHLDPFGRFQTKNYFLLKSTSVKPYFVLLG